MSRPGPADPAKLVIGVLLNNQALLEQVAAALVDRFGPLEAASAWMNFDYTAYYTPEMGAPLWRRMLVFGPLVDQQELAGIKRQTNCLETHFAEQGRRSVNIDPGLLVRERFVLATGKNYGHRIYLKDGIYADLTLIFRAREFQTLPWTYPDYGDRPIRAFLITIRNAYVRQLKSQQRRTSP